MMTLLEAISPTARQLLMMPVVGISKSERHKIHAVRGDGQPLCGGGFMAKSSRAWQNDIGPINCAACLKIKEGRVNK
jgi:hypothetical protein